MLRSRESLTLISTRAGSASVRRRRVLRTSIWIILSSAFTEILLLTCRRSGRVLLLPSPALSLILLLLSALLARIRVSLPTAPAGRLATIMLRLRLPRWRTLTRRRTLTQRRVLTRRRTLAWRRSHRSHSLSSASSTAPAALISATSTTSTASITSTTLLARSTV